MKTTYECECCEEEYPTAKKCIAHERICRLAEKTAAIICDKMPSVVKRVNIEGVLSMSAKIHVNLVLIRDYMLKNPEETFVIGDKEV